MNKVKIKPYYTESDIELYQDDCRNMLNILDRCSVRTVFADPPYNLSNGGITCKSGELASVSKGNWDRSQGFDKDYKFTQEWVDTCKNVLEPGGSLFVSGSHHNIHMVGYELQRQGFKIINDITWVKKNAPPNITCKTLAHKKETILWAVKRGLKYTFNYKWGKETLFPDDEFKNDGKQMTDVWFINTTPQSEKKHGKHPTQKPIKLLERIINISTNPGDLVVDPFCGSGTTGVVAKMFNRKFVGIDLDEKDLTSEKQSGEYLDLTIRRLNDLNLI